MILVIPMTTFAADKWGLDRGTPDIQSAGALAFGPDDILFVGDTKGAAIFAISTGDTEGERRQANVNIDDAASALSDVCGADADIHDLAVNPRTGSTFISLTAGSQPAICRIDGGGNISQLFLDNAWFSKATLPDPPEDKVVVRRGRPRNRRDDAITDIAWYEGRLIVSGLQSAESPSNVREFSFPFARTDRGAGIEIFHAAHGKLEDYAAPRTFVTLMIDGQPNLLAAYVCTPLVRIPLKELTAAGDRIRATTVAELGNRNRPLDMISYSKGDSRFLLLSNSNRGVMKITTAGLTENTGLTERVTEGRTAGQTYQTVDSLEGVIQMDQLNDDHAIVLMDADGTLALRTVPLP